MPRICFCVPHAYALFNPACKHPFGGSEVQSWLLARGLARNPANQVSFVVLNHRQPAVEKYGKIRVYRHTFYSAFPRKIDAYREEIEGIRFKQAGFPWIALSGKTPATFYKSFRVRVYDFRLNLLHRFMPPLYIENYEIIADKIRVFDRVGADIYIASGVHETAAEIAAYCKQAHKKFVLLAASDYDFSPDHAENVWEKDRYNSFGHLCYYAIQQAGEIVAQTRYQQQLLKQQFGRESTVITNPVDFETVKDAPLLSDRKFALWIGKADRVKRPDLLLEIARRSPKVHFKMVMNPSHNDIDEAIRCDLPGNIEIIDYVPYEHIEDLFANAFALLNTSDFEGFPNTFLQAGKYAVPILSLHADPDSFIKDYECGVCADGNLEALVKGLDTLVSNPKKAESWATNCHDYVKAHHDLDDKARQLESVFSKTSAVDS